MCRLSLALRLMTVVFGLEMRLHVHMHAKLENGILHNGQQSGSAVNSSIDQGEFEIMKTLSGCRGLRCDKKWHFCYHTLWRLAVFHDEAFGQLYESC